MGGVGCVSRQHDVAVVPAPVGDRAKVQPRGTRTATGLPDQSMTVKLPFEELLEEGKAVLWRHGAKTEAGPRSGRAFDDKRARSGVDPVAVSPHPAATRLDEGIREGLEYLGCPQPDVLVAAQSHIGLESFGCKPGPAVGAVAGDDQICFWQLLRGHDLPVKLDTRAQASRSVGQDVQQAPSADAVAAASRVPHLLTPDIDNLVELAEGGPLDLP